MPEVLIPLRPREPWQLGIPFVYIDIRNASIKNTDPNIKVLGEYERAQALIVTDKLAEAKPEQPLVFIERAASISDDCCMSVEMAGGLNMAKEFIPGALRRRTPTR